MNTVARSPFKRIQIKKELEKCSFTQEQRKNDTGDLDQFEDDFFDLCVE